MLAIAIFRPKSEKATKIHMSDIVANRIESRFARGAVVQLVRIPACHAVGREFESRPHSKC